MTLFSLIRRIWISDGIKADIALSRDEASRFLPWIIALMVYLAALTLAGGFTLHHTVVTSHAAQTDSFSVHLPHMADKADETTAAVVAIIKNTPGIADAQALATSRIREMVEPWLGRSEALSTLPLPIVIDAKMVPGSVIDYAALKARIGSVTPGVEIDDHKQWIAQFSSLVRLIQWILCVIAFFIISATACVVVFACKMSLKIHRGTVHLLHRLGALDSYIAQQFQYHAAFIALKGAFVGSGFAAGTILAMHLMARHIDSPLFPSFALSLPHAAILLLLPLGMSLIALLSARMSVLAALHKML